MMRVELLGGCRVYVDGGAVDAQALGGTKPRQLLEILALQVGQPATKDWLADQLWEGRPPASYVATLESYTSVLRRRLHLASGRRSPLMTVSAGYVLDADRVEVDLHETWVALEAEDPQAVLDGVAGLRGELLASDPYPAWATHARDDFAQLVGRACTRAAHAANGRGERLLAVGLARTAVQHRPLDEAAWRELMTAAAEAGSRADALDAYADLRRGLREELGVDPGPETQALYLRILDAGPVSSGVQEVSLLVRLLQEAVDAGAPRLLRDQELVFAGRRLARSLAAGVG